jgi:hypothetical protein
MKRFARFLSFGGDWAATEEKTPNNKVTAMQNKDVHPTPPQGALKMRPAAQYLGGLSKATMLRLVKNGLLRPNRKTRHLLFSVRELEEIDCKMQSNSR